MKQFPIICISVIGSLVAALVPCGYPQSPTVLLVQYVLYLAISYVAVIRTGPNVS